MGNKERSALYRTVAVTLGACLLLFFWAAFAGGVPFSKFLPSITARLYPFRNENMFMPIALRGLNLSVYAYILIVVSAVISYFLRSPHGDKPSKGKKRIISAQEEGRPVPFSRIAFVSGIVVFLVAAALQLIYQANYLSREVKTYSGKTESERNALFFGHTYDFTEFCRQRLPGLHRAEYITDLDPKSGKGLMVKYWISYHILPINVSISTDEPIDAYVVFQKEDPAGSVPEAFGRHHIYASKELLAVRGKKNDTP